jgi:hypothetical protein
MDYNFPFLEKLNFASFQNGGFAQNGHKKCFLTIPQSILKNFMFSLLILVNGHIPHKSYKKSFLSDSKWRLKFKMATNFQSAVSLVLIFFLNFFCILLVLEMRKNCGRRFFILAQDGAACPRGWSKIVFLP